MPDWKKIWNGTHSGISGIVIFLTLLMRHGSVNYSWFLLAESTIYIYDIGKIA